MDSVCALPRLPLSLTSPYFLHFSHCTLCIYLWALCRLYFFSVSFVFSPCNLLLSTPSSISTFSSLILFPFPSPSPDPLPLSFFILLHCSLSALNPSFIQCASQKRNTSPSIVSSCIYSLDISDPFLLLSFITCVLSASSTDLHPTVTLCLLHQSCRMKHVCIICGVIVMVWL